MLICGLKLTHDGGISLINDGRLLVQIDTEKVANNGRYSSGDFDSLVNYLDSEGIQASDIDSYAIDGWHPVAANVRSEVRTTVDGRWRRLPLAGYAGSASNPLDEALSVSSRGLSYRSFPHICSHLMSAYCTSPFASEGEDSYILVWDGGMRPTLYFWSYRNCSLARVGTLLPAYGSVYADFAAYFPPFATESIPNRWDSWPELDRMAPLSSAGKVMAYSALGTVDRVLARQMADVLIEENQTSETVLLRMVRVGRAYEGPVENLFSTVQEVMGRALVSALQRTAASHGHRSVNLCFVGGCALNLLWNRTLRVDSGFERVWVPPFPNDSGSALGVACAEMVMRGGGPSLDWNVYAGPHLAAPPPGGWPCSTSELAELLHATGQPVVILHGRAELGPRALGNRSILAAPIGAGMRSMLNDIKGREPYRPVAPICLEELSDQIFSPGGHDPYMLFAHSVRPEWVGRIPAAVHVDGSARLQTVSDRDNPVLAEILRSYHKLSGIPVLCNTSANYSGSGFFPDVRSALEWGRAPYVWSDGLLFDGTDSAGSAPTG